MQLGLKGKFLEDMISMQIVNMKNAVLIRQNSYPGRPTYQDELDETKEFVVDDNCNGYIITKTEYKNKAKVARTLQINTSSDNSSSIDFTISLPREHSPKLKNEVFSEEGTDSNTQYKPNKVSRKISSTFMGRKPSIARIGSAFREIQQTIKPRRVRGRRTTDCNFPTTVEENPKSDSRTGLRTSASLPNIKSDKDGNSRRNGKKNKLLRRFSAGGYSKQSKSSPPKIDFDNVNIISFPSNRLEAYRTNSHEKHLDKDHESEMNAINKRRSQGRSRSAQLPNGKILTQLRRQRSFSTDCDDHLFSFDKLVAKRLNSSKETQLCETDL